MTGRVPSGRTKPQLTCLCISKATGCYADPAVERRALSPNKVSCTSLSACLKIKGKFLPNSRLGKPS